MYVLDVLLKELININQLLEKILDEGILLDVVELVGTTNIVKLVDSHCFVWVA